MKRHTLIFVPHARAKFRKWRFTSTQAAVALATALVLTVASLVGSVFYLTRDFDPDELARIEAENAALREMNQSFENSLVELEGQLGDYEDRIHKLAIVAGLTDLAPSGEAGIGGEDPGDSPEDVAALSTQLEQLGAGMDRLQRKLDERRLMISATPAISPVAGILTSGFGYRRDPFTGSRAFHNGLDFVAPPGKDVHVTGDGVVTRAGRERGLGNAVYVSHGFGITTRYGHLSKTAVEVGQRVRRGDVVGHVGSTGRSTGYHLHYEVRVDGQPVNPLGYILDQDR